MIRVGFAENGQWSCCMERAILCALEKDEKTRDILVLNVLLCGISNN